VGDSTGDVLADFLLLLRHRLLLGSADRLGRTRGWVELRTEYGEREAAGCPLLPAV